jgi:hypothetical protein
MIKLLKLKEPRTGRGAYFSPQGKLALMFIKAYIGLSDRKLVEHLNGSFEFQMFCGIFLCPERLVYYKFVSKIRTALAEKLQISTFQQAFAKAWKPYIQQPDVILVDATCYESYIRYPTNIKLIDECVDWMYGQMKLTCKYLKIRTPRNKFLEQKEK